MTKMWRAFMAWFRRVVLRQKPRRVGGEGFKRTPLMQLAARSERQRRRGPSMRRAHLKRVRKGMVRLWHWATMGRTPMDA
jgi:hypothetical protein